MNLKNLFGKKEVESGPTVQAAPGTHAPGIAGAVAKLFDKNEKEVAKIQPIVAHIASLGGALKEASDEELKDKSAELKARFQTLATERLQKIRDPQSGENYDWQPLESQLDWSDDYVTQRVEVEKAVLDELLPEAFALVREASDRTIGLRHFDVQMIGGTVLHSGRIGEMRTGEGKTLVATLPVYLNALGGRGVHLITVNDYLAERDANWMRPIYEFLGLSVSFLTNDMETEQRQRAYASDVLYATNSEVGFDYLRDNMARSAEETVQRPLNFAIVDEVDNILIDEARTPLIISAQVAKSERAYRRQQLAQVCDGVARQMMPAVTDHEIEALQDSLTARGRIDIESLMRDIEERGAFNEAIAYLVDAYLIGEKSARVENAARLLDVADEYSHANLIDDAGRESLEKTALSAIHPDNLRAAWSRESARLVEPFSDSYAEAAALNFDAQALSNALLLNDATASTLGERLDGAGENRAHEAANIVAEEMARRGLVEESGVETIAAALQTHEVNGALEPLRAHLTEAALQAPGALGEVDALLGEAAGDDEKAAIIEGARHIVETLEHLSLNAMLPYESLEHLWEAVRLPQSAELLQKEIARTISQHPGEAAQKTEELAGEYSQSRAAFLDTQSDALKTRLAGFDGIAARAKSGEHGEALRRALQNELAKSGAFGDAVKIAKKFVSEQKRAHQEMAAHLAQEMSEWVEVPRDAPRVLAELFDEGGAPDEVRERVMLAVRDLPGENTEIPALVSETVRQMLMWRAENGAALVQQIAEKTELTPEASGEITRAVEAGEFSSGFENFVGEQLLTTPAFAEKAAAIESFNGAYDDFKNKQNEKMLGDLRGAVELSSDAEEAMAELLEHPQAELKTAIFDLLSGDATSRHLEALLTEENAASFAEEVKRRVPLAKDIQKRVKASDFVGRSAEQLERAITRLVLHTFEVMPIEDFKRVIRNLGWATEKDEKRRQSAPTDIGTLIAEREAASPAFTDPENFLETLTTAEILTEDEAITVRRGLVETPDESLTAVIDRVLRLPAERRRRIAESKLQEVQPILDQSIKAHGLFQREVNYVIDAGKEIVIVDEFTGRKMPGRRYSEGLHEALEAKHGLEVQLESQTVATITIQNYFRLYNKLGGMTGTAKTEEAEFAKTYGIEVVSIPTNRQIQRRDYPDMVYKTAEAKARAITFDILEHHCAGQPVLVGTRSVEVSERMAERLKATPLQLLALAQLIKLKLWDDKSLAEENKRSMISMLQTPVMQMNPLQVKNLAKQVGVDPDPANDENIDRLMSLFDVGNASRERLATAMRVGLPHNVLNAKNHRNEARIVAEAARPGSVTIATNMAGRGVDIVLGGTLDGESRWRVITLQILARQLEGKAVHVRSRNEETTQKLLDRMSPQRLQDLAWLTALRRELDSLEESKAVEGQVAKELRDTLSQEISTADLKTKVKSRARRLGLSEKLPLESEPSDARVLAATQAELKRLMHRDYEIAAIDKALQSGIAARASGRDEGESALLEVLSHPLLMAKEANGALLRVLASIESLDAALLRAVAEGTSVESDNSSESEGAESGTLAESGVINPLELAQSIGNVTPDWVAMRLNELEVTDAASAREKLDSLDEDVIEINEAQILAALGEMNMGLQWLRERFGEWKIVDNARAFELPEEVAQMIGDTALVHSTLDRDKAEELLQKWEEGGAEQRELISVEAPNMVLLGDLAEVAGQDAPFLNPQWMHDTMTRLGIIEEGDVAQAQMMAQAQDEEGNVQNVPVDVLVYRIHLPRVLAALAPDISGAMSSAGADTARVFDALTKRVRWLRAFADEEWLDEQMRVLASAETAPIVAAPTSGVEIETGVSGQSSDIVLESEPRPEDIAHTSEGEEVKALGGLHIIGSERHESRRIDNQLRGRAGRQGDPGSSRFYVSLEDELWRLFGVRNQGLLKMWDEDEAVESKMISSRIEGAQKKVELNHFEGRKNVLQYDDVMNVQREVIYRERRRALLGGDLRDTVLDMAERAALTEAATHCPQGIKPEEWDVPKLYHGLARIFGASNLGRHIKAADLEELKWIPWHAPENDNERHDYEVELHDGRRLREIVETLYAERETTLGEEQMRGLERWQVTRSIDDYWMEHLAEMDYLRDAIWQQGYAQKEPIGVYRQEGYAMFQKMLGEIRREVSEGIFGFEAPSFDFEEAQYAGPQISGMHEARLMAPLLMGEEEEALLQKDADGGDEDEDDAMVLTGGDGEAPQMSRAQRRAQKRGK